MLGMVKPLMGAMSGRGFAQVNPPLVFGKDTRTPSLTGVNLWFFGAISAARGPASVYVHVPDLSFVVAPVVYLTERPTWLVGWRPHLLRNGLNRPETLCYSDHEQYQLLAYDPARAILRVLEDAKDTLNRIAQPDSVLTDSQRDLARLWPAAFDNAYIDVEPAAEEIICATAIVSKNGAQTLLVSSSPKELAAKLGLDAPSKLGPMAVVYPDPAQRLYLTASGPPNDLLQIKKWLQDVSPETFRRWHKNLQSLESYRDGVRLHFFRNFGQVIGYVMNDAPSVRQVRSARQMRQFIQKHVYEKPLQITRLRADRFDEEYLIRRNLQPAAADLRGVKILLVGCGAVGSHMSQGLVQIGAGIGLNGKKGRLTLCDFDLLSSGNIGRHLLGTRYIGSSKASALQLHLRQFRPTADVEAVPLHFHDLEPRLEEFELIIDACGYESLSRHMSKLLRYTGWFKKGRALLNSWIEGQGGVTRCLLQDSASAACFDCLWNYGPNIEPFPRDAAYTEAHWNEHTDDGYATMTSFSVSAPQAAAALAIDAILAWRSGEPSPRFRSRSAEGKGIKPSISKDVARAKACPGCSG